MQYFQPEYWPPADNFVEKLGRRLLLFLRDAGNALLITGEAFWCLKDVWWRRREVVRQLFNCGIRSFGVVTLVAMFNGMILALQAGLVLKMYNQEVQVGNLVSQTIVREMGPFMTALILAASVGSAIAAQIGTMQVSDEIAALHVMSVNPASFLVMPRLVAFMVMAPVLTVYSNLVGVSGGMLVAYTQLGVTPRAYYDNAMMFLSNKELYVGLLKAWVFGIIIVGVASYQGLTTTNGAMGVGRATRATVVHSFLLILICGYIVTRIFY